MTHQEIFNKVYTHLLTQGVKSEAYLPSQAPDEQATCAYRGENGTSCAVGCLIPDEFYRPEMEGKAAFISPICDALVAAGVIAKADLSVDLLHLERYCGAPVDLLMALQHVHDSRDPQDWPERLAGIADRFSLTIPTESPA